MNERWTHRVPTKCKLVLLTHQLLRQWNTPHRRRLLRHFRRLCHFPHPVLLCSNVPTVTLRQPESFDEHAWKWTKKKNHCVWQSATDEMWISKTRTNWSRLNFRVISLKINFRLKGESPNSHQLKGWFLIRGKEIVCVKEKQKPLGDNRYDNFTPREGRGGTLRLGQGRYHRQLFPSGDTSFLL